jgi:cell division protein FtsI/penicillin-binding protein 2
MGFQKKTGIDLPTEVKNIFPDGLDFWKRHYHYTPYDNEVMSLSIGQGAVTHDAAQDDADLHGPGA